MRKATQILATVSLLSVAVFGNSAVPKSSPHVHRAAVTPQSPATPDSKQLFEEIAAQDGLAVVGLKRSDLPHGVVEGRVLITDAERSKAKAAVSALQGIELVRDSQLNIPVIRVRVASQQALDSLRAHGNVDYVHPLRMAITKLSSDISVWGCDENPYSVGDQWGAQIAPNVLQSSFGTDLVPWNYEHKGVHHVNDAWARSNGRGVTVAVLDTGIYASQTQLRSNKQWSNGRFNTGAVTTRTEQDMQTNGADMFDANCSHGTRVASTIAAPLDGHNMVGVAFGSNLINIRMNGDTVAQFNTDDAAAAIQMASSRGAKVIQMAWGLTYDNDTIRNALMNARNSGALLVAAAGSNVCTFGVYFPAKYPFVVAVTGLDPNNPALLAANSCGGPEVDLGAINGELPAAGRDPEGGLIHFGGASAASAFVSGVAALVRSRYPSEGPDQITERLLGAAAFSGNVGNIGRGGVDAYKALGGIRGVSISTNITPTPGQPYSASANFTGGDPGETMTYRYTDRMAGDAVLASGTVTAVGGTASTNLPAAALVATRSGSNTLGITVVDSTGISRSSQVSFNVSYRMSLQVVRNSTTITTATITVNATDAGTGGPVSATISRDGAVVGQTNQPFTYARNRTRICEVVDVGSKPICHYEYIPIEFTVTAAPYDPATFTVD